MAMLVITRGIPRLFWNIAGPMFRPRSRPTSPGRIASPRRLRSTVNLRTKRASLFGKNGPVERPVCWFQHIQNQNRSLEDHVISFFRNWRWEVNKHLKTQKVWSILVDAWSPTFGQAACDRPRHHIRQVQNALPFPKAHLGAAGAECKTSFQCLKSWWLCSFQMLIWT